MTTTRFFEVSPGLRIALEEDGDPQGTPVFFFHGWPASRLQGAGFGPAARELGVRILSPDRPGIGLSSFQPGRRLLDWPPVVLEIARQLGIERFRVLAISGGGPYGFATAYALPEAVQDLAVISGAPPLGPAVDPQSLLAVYRWLLRAYRFRPEVLRGLFKLARPFATVPPPRWMWPLLLRLVPAGDRAALADPEVFEGSFACYREAWRGTALGVITDAEPYAHDWGFPLEDIRIPVQLWHGKGDRSFSWRLAEALSLRLPNCQTRFVDDEGHYSVSIRYKREILQALLGSSRKSGDLAAKERIEHKD